MKLKSLWLKKSEKSDEVSVGYRPKPTLNKATFLLVFGVLLASASFYEGTTYQHNVDTTTGSVAATTNPSADTAKTGTKMDSYIRTHILGQVTAVTSTSITVQNENSGNNLTLTVTGSTQIEANGQSIKVSQIQDGDLVIITKTNASGNTAAKIILTQGTWDGSSTNGSSTNQSATNVPTQSLESN